MASVFLWLFAGRIVPESGKRVTVKIRAGTCQRESLGRGFEGRMWRIEHETQRVCGRAGKIALVAKKARSGAMKFAMKIMGAEPRTGNREAAASDFSPLTGEARGR
jgi:hypothetical protein